MKLKQGRLSLDNGRPKEFVALVYSLLFSFIVVPGTSFFLVSIFLAVPASILVLLGLVGHLRHQKPSQVSILPEAWNIM